MPAGVCDDNGAETAAAADCLAQHIVAWLMRSLQVGLLDSNGNNGMFAWCSDASFVSQYLGVLGASPPCSSLRYICHKGGRTHWVSYQIACHVNIREAAGFNRSKDTSFWYPSQTNTTHSHHSPNADLQHIWLAHMAQSPACPQPQVHPDLTLPPSPHCLVLPRLHSHDSQPQGCVHLMHALEVPQLTISGQEHHSKTTPTGSTLSPFKAQPETLNVAVDITVGITQERESPTTL